MKLKNMKTFEEKTSELNISDVISSENLIKWHNDFYLISDEQPKDGDYFFDVVDVYVSVLDGGKPHRNQRKILASTEYMEGVKMIKYIDFN
jgi:hypothetical protein